MADEEQIDEESGLSNEEQRKQEALLERQRKQELKKKVELAEIAKKGKPRAPGQKRKGLGGLSNEKKKLLKQLIMQKAADEMKHEIKKRAEDKENHLKKIIGPLQIEGLNQSQLESKVKDLHKKIAQLEEEKYDWEFKLGRQDLELNELTTKANDTRGKFVKPVLKKITKTESKLEKLLKQREADSLSNVKTQLKSTGQNKFALEEKEAKNPDWRDHLKGGADAAAENGEVGA